MPPIHDLLQATGYAAIAYLLFNYLVSFGSGRPLVEWINPGRRYLPLLAATLIGGAYTSLHVAAPKYDRPHLELLGKLVSEEKAPPEVMAAFTFAAIGAAVFTLAVWCWWFLPRAPQTFSPNPRDLVAEYRRALRHYVRWAGGLDFGVLCEVRSGKLQVIAEGESDQALLRGLNRLPGVHAPIDGKRRRPTSRPRSGSTGSSPPSCSAGGASSTKSWPRPGTGPTWRSASTCGTGRCTPR